MRLIADHSGQIRRAPMVAFTFDGEPVQGYEGESLAVALMRSGHLHLRDAPVDGAARGAFCCMGLCQECVVQIDDAAIESCGQNVAPGLAVVSFRRRV